MERIKNDRDADVPVDMVFTYVNGKDPSHLRKRKRIEQLYQDDEIHLEIMEGKDFNVLYNNVEEITFSVRTVLTYLPWIRRIFIITDQQRPPVEKDLLDSGRVHIVDHTDILEEQYLPTFNCEVIESCLHRIRGLSEIFIYDNDDIMHFSPLAVDDLFTVLDSSRIGLKLYAYPAILRYFLYGMSRLLPDRWPVANSYTLNIADSFMLLRKTRDDIPWWKIIVPKHMTMIFRKSAAERLEDEFKDTLHVFRKQPFRMRGTLSYSTLLYTMEKHWHPYDTVQPSFIFDDSLNFEMFDFNRYSREKSLEKLWRKVEASQANFACLNNIRENQYEKFIMAMQRKGLGKPMSRRSDDESNTRSGDV